MSVQRHLIIQRASEIISSNRATFSPTKKKIIEDQQKETGAEHEQIIWRRLSALHPGLYSNNFFFLTKEGGVQPPVQTM